MENKRLNLQEALDAAYPKPYSFRSMPASHLIRNDRVQLYVDEMSYLVDRVMHFGSYGTRVVFSAGITIDYPANANVQVRV